MGFWGNIVSRLSSPTKYVKGPRSPIYVRGTTAVSEDTAMQVAAFYRGVIYISSQIAKLPWDIKDADNKIQQGPISNLLNLAANPEMNSFRFKMLAVSQAIITGNFYAEIERTLGGAPIALWPLDSRSMELLRREDGALVYRYTNETGGQVDMEPRDIYHLPNLHTKDGLIGQGVVAYGREVLGISIAADQMASGLFHNSGVPSGILKHPGSMSDEAYKRLKDSWIAQTGGRKTGGTSVLEEGVTYEAINFDPEALQFIQSRQFSVLEIARFLGIPPTKFFDVTAATYSNVENANLEVATDTLDSWAINLEMEADVKLLNNRYGGRYSDIDLYQIFRGDMKTRADYFKAMMGIGALTPNQIRAREGLAAYKEGDNYYIATNNFTPVNRMNELIDADIKQKNKPATAPAKPENKELQDAAVKYLTSTK